MARRLTRNRRDAMCGGVAAGFADYFDVDPVLVRLGFVLLTFASGVGVVFYIVCWVIMPANADQVPVQPTPGEKVGDEVRASGEHVRAAGEKVADEVRAAGEQVRAAGEKVVNEVREVRDSGRGHMVGGVILIGLGSLLLLDRVPWLFYWPYWLRLESLWPLILVAIGVVLLMRSREERV